jgi:hypothetical protein
VDEHHPVRLVVEDDLRRNRVTVFFRILLAIPHLIWILLWTIAVVLAAIAVLVSLLIVVPGSGRKTDSTAVAESLLPPPWRIQVDVLNGAGDINYTRQVASKIQALAYRIGRVTRAPHFGQRRTVVYFEPGGDGIAARLARQLGVTTAPLPGGRNPRRLVVIVGPPNVAGA